MHRLVSIVAIVACLGAAPPAHAAEPPFEAGLLRLSEVLGSLHFLRNLCGDPDTRWRDEMVKLLATENPEGARKERFVASFNRGYRSFAASYSSCTESARAAMEGYLTEGETLSRDISAQYGN